MTGIGLPEQLRGLRRYSVVYDGATDIRHVARTPVGKTVKVELTSGAVPGNVTVHMSVAQCL